MTDQTPEPSETHDAAALLTVTEEILATARLRIERFEPRLRRLRRALHDLGLTTILGGSAVDIVPTGDAPEDVVLRFADLDSTAFDRLVRRLEDIVDQVPEVVVEPAPATQLTLFDVIDFAGIAPGPHAHN